MGLSTSKKLATRATVQELIKGSRAYKYEDQFICDHEFIASGSSADMYATNYPGTITYYNISGIIQSSQPNAFPVNTISLSESYALNQMAGTIGSNLSGLKYYTYSFNSKLNGIIDSKTIIGVNFDTHCGLTGSNGIESYDSNQRIYRLCILATGQSFNKNVTESNLMLCTHYLSEYKDKSNHVIGLVTGPYYVSGTYRNGFINYSGSKVIQIISEGNNESTNSLSYVKFFMKGTTYTYDSASGILSESLNTSSGFTSYWPVTGTYYVTGTDYMFKVKNSKIKYFNMPNKTIGGFTYKSNSLVETINALTGVLDNINIDSFSDYYFPYKQFPNSDINYSNELTGMYFYFPNDSNLGKNGYDKHRYISLYYKNMLMNTFDIYHCGNITGPNNTSVSHDNGQLHPSGLPWGINKCYDKINFVYINFQFNNATNKITPIIIFNASEHRSAYTPNYFTGINYNIKFSLDFYTDNNQINPLSMHELILTTDFVHGIEFEAPMEVTNILNGDSKGNIYINCTFDESNDNNTAFSYNIELINEQCMMRYVSNASGIYYMYLCQNDTRIIDLSHTTQNKI